MPRLSSAAARLPYDPALVDIGIVHLGVGAFHRAHMADYTDAVLRKGDLRWGIMGASLRAPDTRDALAPQDFLYTLAESDETGKNVAEGFPETIRLSTPIITRSKRLGILALTSRTHVRCGVQCSEKTSARKMRS